MVQDSPGGGGADVRVTRGWAFDTLFLADAPTGEAEPAFPALSSDLVLTAIRNRDSRPDNPCDVTVTPSRISLLSHRPDAKGNARYYFRDREERETGVVANGDGGRGAGKL